MTEKRLIDFETLWEFITDPDENCCRDCDTGDSDECNEHGDCPVWQSLEVPDKDEIFAHAKTITGLQKQIAALKAENDRLKEYNEDAKTMHSDMCNAVAKHLEEIAALKAEHEVECKNCNSNHIKKKREIGRAVNILRQYV